jgi:HSP20 family protein
MARRNPFEELEDLFDRMSRQFDEAGRFREIAVDVAEDDDEFVVTADLPGFDREEIDLTLDGRRLGIAAERDREETASDDRFVRRERVHDERSRSLLLPGDVAAEDVSAIYTNGVLTVHLPKTTPDEAGHRIEIGEESEHGDDDHEHDLDD